jgi:hypothetical protein
MTTLFPSIIPDSEDDFVDDSYSRSELEAMEWDELRNLAKRVDSDDVNGRMDRETIEDYLTGHERL